MGIYVKIYAWLTWMSVPVSISLGHARPSQMAVSWWSISPLTQDAFTINLGCPICVNSAFLHSCYQNLQTRNHVLSDFENSRLPGLRKLQTFCPTLRIATDQDLQSCNHAVPDSETTTYQDLQSSKQNFKHFVRVWDNSLPELTKFQVFNQTLRIVVYQDILNCNHVLSDS